MTSSPARVGRGLRVIMPLVLLALPISTPARAEQHTVTLERAHQHLIADWVQVPDAQRAFVLVHGTMAHKDMEIIETLQTLLGEHGEASLAPTLSLGIDNRQGFFDCSATHTHRHQDAADEIAAWVRWLRDKSAYDDIVLVGHSRGATQVLDYLAATATPKIAAAVLIGLSTQALEPGPELAEAQALQSSGRGAETLHVGAFLHCSDATVTADSYVSYYGQGPDHHALGRLAQYGGGDVPLLVIAGSRDQVNHDVPAAIAGLDRDKRPPLVVIDGADHFFRDLYADELVEALIEFVDEL